MGAVTGLQTLEHRGLVGLSHVGSSWTRDRTGVPCFAKHRTTSEVLMMYFKTKC